MAKLKIRGKELIKIGYPQGRAIGMAINIAIKHYKRHKHDDVIALLKDVLQNQDQYADDPILGRIVTELRPKPLAFNEYELEERANYFKTYGAKGIDAGAIKQMDIAMRLPITQDGALMADAHLGYGLPIGGVLATENAIIPYGVGMDIGCRMCLSVYDISAGFIDKNRVKLKDMLVDNTRFGFKSFDKPIDDPIFERKEFQEIPILQQLKKKAYSQIGSSGSGNHFVEFGIVDIQDIHNEFGVPVGTYLGLLSHSGSRGFGANIAKHYTNIAMDNCKLPKEAKHLAWLNLDKEAGMEYWLAMNLAGDYASACHHQIHRRLSASLGEHPLFMVENHHNFAWKEQLADGREVIVHRKGATPAGKGVLGIIPGSMTAPGFIVRGKGVVSAINSASHGAGRKLSRTKAKNSITKSELNKYLKKMGVDLIGGDLDEAPIAYKDIHQVMEYQKDLVDVIGTFLPKIVRMA